MLVVIPATEVDRIALPAAFGHAHHVDEEVEALLRLWRNQLDVSEVWLYRASATAGYNGAYLGPTLRVHSGEDARLDVTNRLQQETTVHWHGLLVPSDVDGGPHNAIAPGATRRPTLSVRQPATTAW